MAGSTALGSFIVSSSETWSPLASDTAHSSSSATTDELEIWIRLSWKSSIGHLELLRPPRRRVGVAAQLALELRRAPPSISRALARTERGTQSSERSSSMIEPLMRATAKVSNLISRSGSKRSIAPIRPEQAVRDQVGLLDVRRAGRSTSGPATNFTSGE